MPSCFFSPVPNIVETPGFYPSTFVYSRFSQRFSFFTVCLVQWLHGVAPWWTPNGKLLWNLGLESAESQNFRVLSGILRKGYLERYMQISFMRVCKYLNQGVRRIVEQNGKSFKGFSKTKKRKKTHEEIEFQTQFKIEFLLPFTG